MGLFVRNTRIVITEGKFMKKLTVLFISTLIGGGALNGMLRPRETQEQPKRSYWDYLPRDLKKDVIKIALQDIIKTALAESDNIDQAINAIKSSNMLQGASFDRLFNLF